MTDLDRLNALAATVPGDAASWAALAKEARSSCSHPTPAALVFGQP